MAKAILSKKSSGLNLTQQQIYILREIIELGNQMANFLSDMSAKQIANADFKMAMKLVGEWHILKNIFMGKITSILECAYSLEKACVEYSKLISGVNNDAKVIMASMLDRIRQDVNHLRNFLINP